MLAFYFRLSVFLWKKRKLGLHQGLKTSPSITRPSVNEFRKGWTWNEFSPQWPATASFSVNSNVTDLKYRIWQLEWRQEFEEILYMKMLFDFIYEISHKEFDLLDYTISYSILYNNFAQCLTCNFGLVRANFWFWPHKSWWWFAPCCSSRILKKLNNILYLFQELPKLQKLNNIFKSF